VKFTYNPNFLAVFFLLLFSFFALKDLARPGFYTSHDGETHVARIAQYYQAITDGQIPPRWAKTLNGGLGSPIFVYIYPLPYLLASAIHFFGVSFTSSFEILIATTFVLSELFAFLWLKEVFNSQKAAFLGALFYTWVPYKFSLIYVRGSISEALAYTFVPALLWSLTRLSKNTNLKHAAVTSLFFATILLSQNLVAYMILPVIAGYILILSILHKSIKYFILTIFAAIWGLIISSVTYLPVIFERNLIHFDELFQKVYNAHFITLNQLIHSPWDYGFSLPGLNDSMSFQIGLANILVVFLTIVLTIILLFGKAQFSRNTARFLVNIPNQTEIVITIFFFIIFIISIFLMLDIKTSVLFWKNFKPIQFVDIPWRFLGISAIAAAFLASFVAKTTRSGLFFLLIIAAVIIANRNHLRINEPKFYSDDFFLNYQGSATQYNEFTPRTRYSTGVTDDFNSRIESIKGNINIYDLNQKSNLLSFNTQNEKPARIQVNLIKFKGWQIFMDGQKFVNDPTLVDKSYSFAYRSRVDTSGLSDLIVPQGQHNFIFKYKETSLRNLANILSILSILLALSIIVKRQNAKV